jgi:excisionase family DNA binding protein
VDYLTAEEVSELLKVSSRTVARWASQDSAMPAIRIGRVVRFERTALERWLFRKTTGKAQRSTLAPSPPPDHRVSPSQRGPSPATPS